MPTQETKKQQNSLNEISSSRENGELKTSFCKRLAYRYRQRQTRFIEVREQVSQISSRAYKFPFKWDLPLEKLSR